MKRSVLVLILLVSVGMNAGILATLLLDSWRGPQPAADTPRETGSSESPTSEDASTTKLPRPDDPGSAEAIPAERAVGGLVDRLIQRLGLDGEVAEQFRELQYDLYRQMRVNQRRTMQVQFQLRRELAGDLPDTGVLRGLVEDSGRLHAERQELLVRAILRSREILDRPQQREYQNFLSLLGRHMERRRNGPPREEIRRRLQQRRNPNGSP
jgi:hypothetical protein